jgi:hypothetical protein
VRIGDEVRVPDALIVVVDSDATYFGATLATDSLVVPA